MVAIPDPEHVPADAVRARARRRSARMICDVVTPDGKPYEGDPRYVLRRALERMQAMGFDTFNVGPELEYFLFEDDTGHRDARRGRLLRDDDAGRRDRAAPARRSARSSRWASRSSTSTTRSGPRSTRSTCASRRRSTMADHTVTYRLIVKEIAKKAGYHATFMPKPIFGENGSGMHTHHVALHRRAQRVLRRRRPVAPLRRRQGVHRRPAPARARDLGGLRAVGQLVQAARARATRRRSTSRGRSGNRSALIRIPLYKPGSEQATRAEIRCPIRPATRTSRSRRSCTRGSRGSSRATSCRSRWRRTSTTSPPSSGASAGIVSLPETLGEAIDELARVRARAQGARPAHLRPLRRAEAQGVGRLPRPADRLGARALLIGPLALSERVKIAGASPLCGWRSPTDGRSRGAEFAPRGRSAEVGLEAAAAPALAGSASGRSRHDAKCGRVTPPGADRRLRRRSSIASAGTSAAPAGEKPGADSKRIRNVGGRAATSDTRPGRPPDPRDRRRGIRSASGGQ